MSDRPFPEVSVGLLKALEARYPRKLPTIETHERQLWIEVGQQQVLEHLRTHYEKQSKNVLQQSA